MTTPCKPLILVIALLIGLLFINDYFCKKSPAQVQAELQLRQIASKAHTAEDYRKIWAVYKDSPLAETAFFLAADWLIARINCATSGGEIDEILNYHCTHEGVLLVELKYQEKARSLYSPWLRAKMKTKIEQIEMHAKERMHQFAVKELEKELKVDEAK
ncbi:MAG TPA: hypothetical protein P5056_03285 [Candidatus Paceibacterota bacterium]|nr:hypothetical protein [Candidatus Paceibacterota bacterium]